MFTYKSTQSIEWLCFRDDAHCIAGVSTRSGGFSKGEYATMNLGINTKDEPALIAQNRQHFFSSLAPNFAVAYLNQTHSADILSVDASDFNNFADGDGLFTTQKKHLLSITIADCGSVLMIDKDAQFCGAVHCGWRGTQQGIVSNLCAQARNYASLDALTAYMGPMIMPQNYEVGEEFADYFGSSFFVFNAGKRYFDLNKAIEQQLRDSGIRHIINPRLDTFSETNRFFSHRRNAAAGRMCAFIGLR